MTHSGVCETEQHQTGTDWNTTTQRETSIRKNGLISETEAKNCITQEHTFTKIILTASATQLVHIEGQRNQKNLNS